MTYIYNREQYLRNTVRYDLNFSIDNLDGIKRELNSKCEWREDMIDMYAHQIITNLETIIFRLEQLT